ncbi:uncharacterized protein LOC101847161 [Aplysia californica]|uniref:Uncharacterized protein LOC101847161 n=1 Tax=Aplysia californica TaxID=6500 RepID=A0ABM1ACV1_APLCA|nr:uncharacterized protein LOC101847161 [Aplysia californica]
MVVLDSVTYIPECLGFLVLMVLVIQLFLTLRAKVMERLHHYSLARDPATHNGAAVKKLSNSGIPKSSSNTSINGAAPSPKSVSYSKQDVCVTTFSRNNAKIVTSQAELLLRNIDDSKTFVKPQSCVIESLDILCECPKSKLYLLFVDAASCGTRPDDVTTAAATTTTAATATINSEPKTTTADQPDLTSQPAILSQTELLLLTVRHVKSMGGLCI